MSKSYALAVHQLQTTLARATGLSTHILLERARADASDGPHRRSAATDHVRVLFEPLEIVDKQEQCRLHFNNCVVAARNEENFQNENGRDKTQAEY